MNICPKTFKDHRLIYGGSSPTEDIYVCQDCGEVEIQAADHQGR